MRLFTRQSVKTFNLLVAGAVLFAATGLLDPATAAAQATRTIGGEGGEGLSGPILLTAEEISYDDEIGVVIARGDVEVVQGDRVLLADRLSFNQQTRTVTASGNIKLLEPSGEVFFAEYVELTDDLREGVIERIRILLNENARIAAGGARRSGGNLTEMSKAVYSPCLVCADDPDEAPLWQVKARRVIHDQQQRRIEYRDASLEMWGVPVFYTPYFSHPDPSVKRETGLLTPDFGSTDNTGRFIRVPFFWAIDDDKDATIDPIYTADEGLIYSGEYRQRFDRGEFEISGSLAIADREVGDPVVVETREDQVRGHVFAFGRYEIDDIWRTGFDVERSTDRTYFRKFRFWRNPGNVATSNAYIEGFNRRNYASVDAFTFQDLRTGPRPDEPLVLPLATFQAFGEPDSVGGRWGLDANLRVLARDDFADSQRVSLEGNYRVPFASPMGFVTTVTASLRGDLYHTEHKVATDRIGRTTEDGLEGRLFPQIAVDWRYPFVRHSGSGQTVIEPVVAYFGAPDHGNPASIANDDSSIVAIDETSLFAPNPLPGLDRVEGGQRLVYGMKAAHYFDMGTSVSAFLGQRYKFTSNDDLKFESGLGSGRSDYVGRIDVRPTRYLDMFYRFRADEEDLKMQRNELGFGLGSRSLGLTGNYTFVRRDGRSEAVSVEELSLTATAQWDRYWGIRARTVRDLEDRGGSLEHALTLRYEDECFIFDTLYRRTFTRSADVDPSEDVFIRLTFKTLGDIGKSIF